MTYVLIGQRVRYRQEARANPHSPRWRIVHQHSYIPKCMCVRYLELLALVQDRSVGQVRWMLLVSLSGSHYIYIEHGVNFVWGVDERDTRLVRKLLTWLSEWSVRGILTSVVELLKSRSCTFCQVPVSLSVNFLEKIYLCHRCYPVCEWIFQYTNLRNI